MHGRRCGSPAELPTWIPLSQRVTPPSDAPPGQTTRRCWWSSAGSTPACAPAAAIRSGPGRNTLREECQCGSMNLRAHGSAPASTVRCVQSRLDGGAFYLGLQLPQSELFPHAAELVQAGDIRLVHVLQQRLHRQPHNRGAVRCNERSVVLPLLQDGRLCPAQGDGNGRGGGGSNGTNGHTAAGTAIALKYITQYCIGGAVRSR